MSLNILSILQRTQQQPEAPNAIIECDQLTQTHGDNVQVWLQ